MEVLRRYFPYTSASTEAEEDEDDVDGPGANARKIILNSIQVEFFYFTHLT